MSTVAQRSTLDLGTNNAAGFLDEIYCDDGYFIADILDANGLAELRSIVNDKFHAALKAKYPELYDEFAELSADQYHFKSHLIDHSNMWRKAMRTFDHHLVERFMALSWKDRLAERVGPFEILGAEEVGLPDIYMRLVRPNAPTDVGPIHADQWFTDLGNHSYDPNLLLVKIWVPVYSEPEKDGLVGVPGSHLHPVHYESELRDGYVKPILPKEVEESINPIRLHAAPGQAVSFRYDFLHGGTVNRGTNTRVSLEATLVLKHGVEKPRATREKAEPTSSHIISTAPQLAYDWTGTAAEFLSATRMRSRSVLDEISSLGLELPAGGVDPADWCDASKLTLLKSLIPSGKESQILMLGSDLGLAASVVSKRPSEGSCFTIIENDRKVADITVRNIGKRNLEKFVSVVQGHYNTVISYLPNSVFYDVIVLGKNTHTLVFDLLPRLSPTGVMLVDDILQDTHVLLANPASKSISPAHELLSNFAARDDYWATVLPVSMGVLMVVRT
jgi:predicted O-methyltransferase YrrM